LRAVLASE